MKFSLAIFVVVILPSIVSFAAKGRSTELEFADETLEVERQLKSLNKPPIKTFKKNGDIIDCIDIYKQPAFDHPLLKDHKLQMRPSALPKGIGLRPRSIHRAVRETEECPHGTVPFRRIKKEELIRGKALLELKRTKPKSSQSNYPSDSYYAAVSTPGNDPSLKFYGAKTSISVYNLTIEDPQISEALLWVGTAVDGPYNSVEYGWTVNPALYGDGQSRTYSMWTADGLQKTGCYNALCPGYVQVSQKRIMGEANHPVTIPGEDVYAMEFQLFRDPNTSNWWLLENLGDEQDNPVGYWPKELFTSLSDSAKVVQLGGKVYSPENMTQPAQMGSGAFLPDDFTRTCYASNIEFVNSDLHFYLPKDVPMNVVQNKPDTYKADYLGDASKDHPSRGYSLVFGGPGIR